MNDGAAGGSSNTLFILWMVVILELVSPLPALLTFGTIYVLLFKPPWFRNLVRQLYSGCVAQIFL